MKAAYATAFAVAGICLLFCIFKAGQNDRKIADVVRKLLCSGLAAVLINIVIVLTTDKNVCMVAYSVFFACMDWVFFYVFLFTLAFCNSRPILVNTTIWRIILALDSFSVLSNNFFHHAFDCREVYTSYGELCFKPVHYSFYRVHLIVCYSLVAFAMVTLIYKAVRTAEIYREKYLLLLLIFAFSVGGDVAYVFTNATINVSILGFALGGIMIYYYAVVFVPREFLKRTLTMVVQGMSDAIFILDEDGKCIHANTRAQDMMKAEELDYKTLEGELDKWRRENGGLEKDDITGPFSREKDGARRHFKVLCHNLLDDKAHYLGCFFTIQNRTEEIENLEKERYLANHDPLTGVYNRQFFFRKVEEQLQENPDEAYLLVCSDVRNFKLINDVFGSAAGDKLLIAIADVLRERTSSGEIFGRLENDRFGLLMKKSEYREDVFLLGPQKIAHSMENDFSYPIQICLGVYEIVNRSIPVSVMCDRAFMAIGTIKGKYGQNIAYYDDRLRECVLREQELTGELPGAIASGQFHIYLQPQISADGKIMGAEALVRWKHPVKGMINPGEFIGIFERNGLIAKLDRHVWELACRQLACWRDRGREELYISINISPKDFYFMDVYETLISLVRQYEIRPEKLKLEITETAVMANLESQLNLIAKLREAGFIVEMDDFGSGYSSLNMLKDIQVDVLKIDMAFLGKTNDKARAEKILKMIVELSRQLEIPVITEGVETAEQVDFLKEIGCDMFQGYFFAKPMEVSDFEEKYM
ncbi:MAG: EAL domain-containing protein [Acetatifactor sp.]